MRNKAKPASGGQEGAGESYKQSQWLVEDRDATPWRPGRQLYKQSQPAAGGSENAQVGYAKQSQSRESGRSQAADPALSNKANGREVLSLTAVGTRT